MTVFLFLSGLACLIIGAEVLVRGASKIAIIMRISPLIIGLTVVALGTSSPELAVSINGVLTGQADIALGNILGSNILNVLLILGLSALIIPLYVSQQLIRFDVPLMIGFSVIVLLVSLDRVISRVDGIVLVSGLFIYIGALFYMGIQKRTDRVESDKELNTRGESAGTSGWLFNSAQVIIGLALLILGSRWLVDSAVIFAVNMGVSELVIGLTVISAGTSMPEVVTSVIAAIRGQRDIAVGNVVGSNIFNILSVLGISSLVAPSGIPVSDAVIGFDIPLMIVVAVACLPIFFTGGIISRWEGALFFSYYIIYITFLVFNATEHDLLPIFNTTMLYFIAPLTVVTIFVVVVQEFRRRSIT